MHKAMLAALGKVGISIASRGMSQGICDMLTNTPLPESCHRSQQSLLVQPHPHAASGPAQVTPSALRNSLQQRDQ